VPVATTSAQRAAASWIAYDRPRRWPVDSTVRPGRGRTASTGGGEGPANGSAARLTKSSPAGLPHRLGRHQRILGERAGWIGGASGTVPTTRPDPDVGHPGRRPGHPGRVRPRPRNARGQRPPSMPMATKLSTTLRPARYPHQRARVTWHGQVGQPLVLATAGTFMLACALPREAWTGPVMERVVHSIEPRDDQVDKVLQLSAP
jgi:hypothetical protein